MDDAYAYDVTSINVFNVIEERLTAMVQYEASMSGRPVDELWQHIELVASRAQVTRMEG